VSYLLELRKLVGSRPLFSPGACVVAFDREGRALLQRRSDTNTWGFPGGSMELGDSLEDTARRELLEETGLRASNLEFVTMLSGEAFRFTYPNGDEIYNVAAIFVTREPTGEARHDHESLELRWFAPHEVPEDLAGPITRWIVARLETLQRRQHGTLEVA
jgi:8-oxo-dGTP pyrophosphatase MutT (NUDIX family)